MNDLKLLDSAMKTPGYITSQMVKCGKDRCKCSRGELHGPYFYYRYWKLYHRTWIQKKKYVTEARADKLTKALEEYKNAIRYMGDNPYRALRRGIRSNIRSGVKDMTQRRLASASAMMKSFG